MLESFCPKHEIQMSEVIFDRPKKYALIGELGSGACGRTVRIRDEEMQFDLVAKKYSPQVSKTDHPTFFEELRKRFRNEAKILFRLNHSNIVRVFNFFDYPDTDTAYILMEYIEGVEIDEFIKKNPTLAASSFEQTIRGFEYLERVGVLHRDIRPGNLLATEDGTIKIIDFGFGKLPSSESKISSIEDKKSVTLNWFGSKPYDFSDDTYDHRTEVYFVGRLFEHAIGVSNLSDFPYLDTLSRMTEFRPERRIGSFREVALEIAKGSDAPTPFTQEQEASFQDLIGTIRSLVLAVGKDAKFSSDADEILAQLKDLYTANMLHKELTEPNELLQVFIKGSYRYYTKRTVDVSIVREFYSAFERASEAKKDILVANLLSAFKTFPTLKPSKDDDDEIPF